MNLDPQALLVAAEHLAGFLIVLLALALLWGLTALMGRIVTEVDKRVPKPAGAPVHAPAAEPGQTDEDLIVVAAAVAATIDAPHRVVSVRPQASSWGQQGRRDIHASRRIR